MRTGVFICLALISLLAGGVARATEGYVVKAHLANLEVGAPIEASTPVEVKVGGHIVVMTSAARMIRRDGPYKGSGTGFLAVPPATPGAPLGTRLLKGLIALAKQSGKSEETSFGTRFRTSVPTVSSFVAGVNAIVAGTSVFCVHAGQWPTFFTYYPPDTNTTLVMQRVTLPLPQGLSAEWPAHSYHMDWPLTWPPPENGRYLVAIGKASRWTMRLIEVGPQPAELLRQAALYYKAGCSRQASAALRIAINHAERR